MTNINIVENKISSGEKYLKILKNYQGRALEDIKKDETLRGAVERYLYLAVQAAIDLAEAVIAFKNLRKPSTYGETFQILKEADIISSDLAEKLAKMVGFRNVIAHDYEEVKIEIVYDILKNRLPDIEAFIQSVKSKL